MDKPKLPKEKINKNAKRRLIKKPGAERLPSDNDLEQIRRELGWGLITHRKHDVKKK